MASKPNPVPGYPPGYSDIANLTIPPGLELLSAHWYYRHAERTPVRRRLEHLGIPKQWHMCRAGKEFATGVLNDPDGSARKLDGKVQDTELMLLRRRVEYGRGNRPRGGGGAECYFGELTDIGRLSTLRLGQQLRALYVDKLAFLPGKLTDKDEGKVYFRSTGIPRTFESLQQAVHGLFPVHDPSYVPTLVQRAPFEETLYPNTLCPTLRALDRASAKRAAEKYNPLLLEPLDEKIGKLLGFPVRIDGHPSASGVLDTIRGCIAHGVPVPKELEDQEVQDTIEKAIVHEWFDGYISKQFRRLSMGRLLGELSERFTHKISNKSTDDLKLALYACHDTTLAGILNTLDVFDNRWPDFTSYVSFELFQKAGGQPAGLWQRLSSLFGTPSAQDHFVRVRYNSRDLKLPACQPLGKHLKGSDGTVCTFEAFRDAVAEVSMTTEEWFKECKNPSSKQ